ncbi:hypothetical protein E2562_024632 [Oryza meyeriana var. granulata]|uniref:Uncharacterized protein n=1 Tax=Oryza meyeriana var. granulata TaxID=110450 RepID=A0A6G1DMV3_9ORYZ|nr:hypothetical protein E2562_024632 [Oryza meyeriana var. granulata]
MDGNTILLPMHVIKMLDDIAKNQKQKAAVVESLAEDSDKVCFVVDSEDSDEVRIVVDSLASDTEVLDSQN